ncbi:MAG: TolC family protein [Desulfuromonadia bacterium]
MNRSERFIISLVAAFCFAAPHPLRAEGITLLSCLEDSRRNNPDLAVLRLDPEIQKGTLSIARSTILPRVDLQGGFTALARPQAVRFGGFTQETQEPRFPFASLTATQILYDFGKRDARIQREESLLSASDSRVEEVRQEIFSQVTEAFYAVARADSIRSVARDEVEMRKKHLYDVEELLAAGVVTRNDQLLAEVKLAESRQNLLAAETALENAWLRLNHLTGRPPSTRGEIELQLPSTAPPEKSPTEHPAITLQKRTIEALERELTEAEAAHRPDLFARLSVDYVDNGKVREQTMYTATIGLAMNLFDGNASRSRVAVIRSTLEREKRRLASLNAAIDLARNVARNDLRLAEERLSVSQKTIEQSTEHLRIATERYRERIGTSTDVIDAQTLLSLSRSRHANDRFDREIARVRLLRAEGVL